MKHNYFDGIKKALYVNSHHINATAFGSNHKCIFIRRQQTTRSYFNLFHPFTISGKDKKSFAHIRLVRHVFPRKDAFGSIFQHLKSLLIWFILMCIKTHCFMEI